ncbi:XRE family transcriptional regulator [Helicobacter sp. 14348-15]|uniref:XRE family transcriptional regulator n=1 Tax=Helicobacter colisuis TaxID=2949739 RepID=UPI00202B9EC6|nr:XRE family transcriptional regulator [Helicobacter colisuis]MCL9820962.1 XRE family transcriptional regulator [Helicobacter colisuis]
MNIGNKIREIRHNIAGNETQKSFAHRFGITERTLQNYESGNTSPTIDFILNLSNTFNIEPNYFLDSEVIPKLDSEVIKNTSEVIPKSSKKITKNNNFCKNIPHSLNDDIVSIPFYEDIRASAGNGAYNETETAEQLNFPKSFLRQYFGIISFTNLSIIIGSGDSMFPTLPENCYLLIQQGDVREGEICVARIDDELYVKRLQKRPKLKLFSDNKNYEPIELEGENFEILGRVVGYFKKTAL